MQTRKLHKLLGLTMLLPFIVWSLSAIFFLVRPGYDDAYARLAVKQYPATSAYTIPVNEKWLEVRHFTTVLGEHLIVSTAQGQRHLHADTLSLWTLPSNESVTALLRDAITVNSDRYGRLTSVTSNQATTSTGVELTLDWSSLSISQYGRDTLWIDRIYSIHYLEWTGVDWIDRILGLAGLFLLIYITYTGTRLAFGLETKIRND